MAVSGGASREMLTELLARVLERAGGQEDGAAGLAGELHAAVVKASKQHQPIEVRFTAERGQLQIAVVSPEGEIWQTSRDVS